MFVIFEGTEGVGKTTLMNKLGSALKADPYFDKKIVLTKEPGGTRLGKKIRKLLLNPNEKMHNLTETLLFLADRVEHIKKVIKPNLKAGNLVMSDRYNLTTLIYQVMQKNVVSKEGFKHLEAIFEIPDPDLAFILVADESYKKEDEFLDNKMNASWKEINKMYKDFYKEKNVFYTKYLINTTKKSIEECIDCCKSAIKAKVLNND